MTAAPTLPTRSDQQVDPRGNAYDSTWVDADQVRHYRTVSALGVGCGPAIWSELYCTNPICGHHLSGKCRGCHRCLDCTDGCS
jgi:hypothetical protein